MLLRPAGWATRSGPSHLDVRARDTATGGLSAALRLLVTVVSCYDIVVAVVSVPTPLSRHPVGAKPKTESSNKIKKPVDTRVSYSRREVPAYIHTVTYTSDKLHTSPHVTCLRADHPTDEGIPTADESRFLPG